MESDSKKRKLNDDEELLWGTCNVQEDELTFALTQAEDTAEQLNSTSHTRLNDQNYAQEGELQMIREKNNALQQKLDLEIQNREGLIHARLEEFGRQEKHLKRENEKLKTELKFRDRDLINSQTKVQSLEKIINNSPRKQNKPNLSVNSNVSPYAFKGKLSFDVKAECKNSESQTEEGLIDEQNDQLYINLDLDNQFEKHNRGHFVSEIYESIPNPISNSTSFCYENTAGPSSIKSDLNLKVIETGNCCCNIEETSDLNHQAETDVISKVITVLAKYYESVNHAIDTEPEITPISNSDLENSCTTEPIHTTASFFNATAFNAPNKWLHLKSSMIKSLKTVINLLNDNSKARLLFLESLKMEILQSKCETPSPGSENSGSSDGFANRKSYSVLGLIIFSATPIIYCKNEVVNKEIIEWVLTLFTVLVSNCSSCCLKPMLSILNSVYISVYLDGTCGDNCVVLALNFLQACSSINVLLENFTQHQQRNNCILNSLAKSVRNCPVLLIEQQCTTITINLLRYMVRRKGVTITPNCRCFSKFISHFLVWLENGIITDRMGYRDFEKHLKFIEQLTSITKVHLEIHYSSIKLTLLLAFLCHSMHDRHPKNELIKQLVVKICKLKHNAVTSLPSSLEIMDTSE